jgi:hypothetical protein
LFGPGWDSSQNIASSIQPWTMKSATIYHRLN